MGEARKKRRERERRRAQRARPMRRLRVCLATTMPGYDHARVLDSVLAQALDLRGADVELMVCDKAIPACQMVKIGRSGPEDLAADKPVAYCDQCVAAGREWLSPLGFPIRRLADYVTDADTEAARTQAEALPVADIRAFEMGGLPVGDHAHAGALRYFARGELGEEPCGEAVLRRYLRAGILSVVAARRLFAERKYDVLVINHGIYVPQGMLVETARAMGVRVVTYNPAYRKHSFVFSHNESYHFSMLSEPLAHWRGLKMTDALKRDTDRYLTSRRYGSNDWIWFHDKPREDVSPVLREIGCDPGKPYVALLTSVVWDAQLHYKANAFPNMLEWLRETVAHWDKRTDDLQLVIRVHPAEVRGAVPSRQRVADEMAKSFPQMPRNVFILPPDNQASTYALCDHADCVIVFNTKAGVEMSALGIPVIVAGEAWIRGKGFALDVSTPAHYFETLDALPVRAPMEGAKRALAIKYAYHFFFRRMIPLPFIKQDAKGKFDVAINGPDDLTPGRWPGLDTICEGILSAKPFIYPAETLADPFPGEVETEATPAATRELAS